MEKSNRIKPVALLPLAMVTLVCIIATIAYGFAFSSNDDGLIRAIASGAYTGKPDAHLIYVMYPLGLFFKCLYSALPMIAWYDLVMLLWHLICWYLLIARIMTCFSLTKDKVFFAILTALLLLTLDFKYLVLHQYTVLSALMVATALVYIVTGTRTKSRGLDSSIVILLLILALWLRKEAFFMGLPMVALALLYHIIKGSIDIKRLKLDLFIVAVIAGMSLGMESGAYSSEEWKAFKEFNQARTEVYDYFKFPEYASYKDTYETLGISEAEYEVLAHYMDVSLNEEVSTQTLKALAEKYDAIMKEWQQYYSVPKKIIKDTALAVIYNDVKPAAYAMFIACLLVFFLFIKKKWWISLFALGAYGYRIVFTAYFVSKGRFPERVSYGLFIIILAFMLSILLNNREGQESLQPTKPSFARYYFICVLAATAVISLASVYKEKALCDERNAGLEALYDYCSSNPDKTFLVNTYTIAPLSENMFTETSIPKNCVILGNWTSKSPLEKERMAYAEITGFEKDLLEKENVLLVERADLDREWIENYYRARGCECATDIVEEISTDSDNNFIVISISGNKAD